MISTDTRVLQFGAIYLFEAAQTLMPRVMDLPIESLFLRCIDTMYQIIWKLIPGLTSLGSSFWLQRNPSTALLASLLAAVAVACGAAAPASSPTPTATSVIPTASPTPEPKLKVVTTTAILADLVSNVGGEQVEVRFVVPPGADVHTFQTNPSHSLAISEADVIVSNGFGLDDFLEPVLRGAKQVEAVRVVAAEGLPAEPIAEMEFPEENHKQEHEPEIAKGLEEMPEQHQGEEQGHEHGAGDPHFWQNSLFTIHYVERIRNSLIHADPANAEVYNRNAAEYIQQLRELDREIAQTLNQVPPERRHLVTFHDAFGHFARRYGWRVSAFVPSGAGEVTPEKVVIVMKVMKAEGIPAVFAEPQFRQDVLEQAARDTGIRVGTIYSDTLDDMVPTYIEMMRFNAKGLAEHLR
jgi:ABC-type Zn uptake system ZnuABC Zn-binding protein ZnuA